MGWECLGAKLRTEEIDESIRGVIRGMAGGNVPHQSDALKFGLYGALRQERAANHPFARLRCPDKSCKAHQRPVSYPVSGNSISCTRHEGGGWLGLGPTTPKIMECSECGHAREDQYPWCKGCRRMFG